jgi:hypothetical protein
MVWPNSIREINDLQDEEKRGIYKTLLPPWLFTDYDMDQTSLTLDGEQAVFFRYPPGSRALEISVKLRLTDVDPLLYLNMADTFNNQILVLLVVVNDLSSERFNIDVDEQGNRTHLGTSGRNLRAEEAAMRAGLAPGQIRRGLRSFKHAVPIFEEFIKAIGHDLFLIEPLAYHNAIIFERYGFSYIRGFREMQRIEEGFRPGGELHQKLTADRVFRHPDYWKTIRGRSWAIHDGILGHPFTGFQMYKRIGIHAGINTFPDGQW